MDKDNTFSEDLKPLNPKQELFCNEYLKDRNGTQAAIRAGYSPDTAQEQASRLLSNVIVKARINELIKEQLDNIKIDARYILRSLLNSAAVNIADAYDEKNCLKPVSEMPEALQLSIVGLETHELYEGYGDEKELIGYAKKLKLENRQKSLELLGRNLKLFTDVMKLEGLDGLADRIEKARKRAKECLKKKSTKQ